MITQNIIIRMTYEQIKNTKVGSTVSTTNKDYEGYNSVTHEFDKLGENNCDIYCTATFIPEKTVYNPPTMKYNYIDDYIQYYWEINEIRSITVSVYDVDYSIIEYHEEALTGTNQYMIEQEHECLEAMMEEWNASDIQYNDIERSVTFFY